MKQEIAPCFPGEKSSSPVVLLEDRQRYSLVSLARFHRQNSCRKYIQELFAGLQTKNFWASSLEKDFTDFWCVLGRHSFNNKYINQLFCSISISAGVQHRKMMGIKYFLPHPQQCLWKDELHVHICAPSPCSALHSSSLNRGICHQPDCFGMFSVMTAMTQLAISQAQDAPGLGHT